MKTILFHAYSLILIQTVLSIAANAENNRQPLRQPIPINTAEAVMEIFWDPDISDFPQWTLTPHSDCGVKIFQNWAAVDYSWTAKPSSGPVLSLTRSVHCDCSDYDRLILGMAVPQNALIRISAVTDRGTLESETTAATGKNGEYLLDLQGASSIESLTLTISPQEEGSAAGWINWIILQDSERLQRHLDQWNHFDSDWQKWIRPKDFIPSFKPSYGIFITEDELNTLNDLHREYADKQQTSPFSAIATNAASYQPETAIRQFDSGNVLLRDDNGPSFSSIGVKAALAGLVLKDANLLRLAARQALSLVACQYWDYGFTTQYPLSAWELRNFKRSYACEDVAYILDLAGEMFTPAGKRLILRKLAEEGVGPINYGTWRHEYIFDCNQLAFFNTGRMAAYLVLEREYPRVKPYTDIAYHESIENIERAISPDGGYYEGPGYFGSVARRNAIVIQQYARSRGFEYSSAVPEILKRTNDFAAAIASTTEHDNLPICDCDADSLGLDTLLIMSTLLPQSYWTTLCRKSLLKSPPGDPVDILAARRIPSEDPPLPAFIDRPDTGYLSSHRKLGDYCVKLFIMGNQKNAGHCHEDKGSFILEFAGETFAADLGIGNYKDPMHFHYKQCQRHNMLVPIEGSEPIHPQNPLPYDVKPTGQGDETSFHAQIDATPGWKGSYKKWIRRWDSPTPDRLIIEDEYELNQGDAVEFYWQTLLPCEIQENSILITGKNGQAILHPPADCEIRLEVLPLQNQQQQNRIAIRKSAPSGTLRIEVVLEPTTQ